MSEEKGKGKGKARAVSGDDWTSYKSPKAGESSQDSSILTRIAASATGLTRSAFVPPNSNEINEAAALSHAGKGQPLLRDGAASAAWAESSKPSQSESHGAGGSMGLRVGHNEKHVMQSENEFSNFLDGIDSFTPSDHPRGGEVADENMKKAWTGAQPTIGTSRTIAEQETRDGEEALAMLSDPTTRDERFEAALENDENYDWGLNTEQMSQLRALTKVLFPPPEPHGSIAIDSPFNLMPRFEEISSAQLTSQPSPIIVKQWKDQWKGVLTRYTDEVWGGLLPLVKGARKEVEGLKEANSESTERKALRRLESILGQLQKR